MLRHHRDIGTKVSGSRNNKLQPPGEGNAGHPVASPGAPKTPSSRLPHACCHGVDVVADGKKERNSARSRTRDAMQHHPVASPSNGGQQYRSGTRANQRFKIDTYICRNVESIDSSGWLLGASPRRLRMERAACPAFHGDLVGRADGPRGDWRLHGLSIPLWSDPNFFHHPNSGQMDFGRGISAPGRTTLG